LETDFFFLAKGLMIYTYDLSNILILSIP